MTIQLTPEGSIVIDGVKVGKWKRIGFMDYTRCQIQTDEGVKTCHGWDDYSIKCSIEHLLTSGFTPQKWEE